MAAEPVHFEKDKNSNKLQKYVDWIIMLLKDTCISKDRKLNIYAESKINPAQSRLTFSNYA